MVMDDVGVVKVGRELSETFELVKDVVRRREGRQRAGLMLGLQELGASLSGFIGAYYPVYSNIIVVNKTPLRRIAETEPQLFTPYTFHLLLHEYIHSLGLFDEELTRRKAYEISAREFGEDHLATEFAKNMEQFMPNLVYPTYGWTPETNSPIELVKGFDKGSTQGYIA